MKYKDLFIKLVLLLIFLLTWQLFLLLNQFLSEINNQTSLQAFIPTPSTIAFTIYNNFGLLISELFTTIIRAFFEVSFGFLFALFMGVLFWIKPSFRNIVFPILLAVNSFPIVGFTPLIIITFGQGSWLGIVFVSSLISYFPMLIALDHSISYVGRDFFELGRTWGASESVIFRKIVIPLSVPNILSSLKLAVPASIVGATLGEWLGTNHGIGHLVIVSMYQLNPGMVYASLLLILTFSMTVVGLISIVEDKYRH